MIFLEALQFFAYTHGTICTIQHLKHWYLKIIGHMIYMTQWKDV